jgi:hypothetical protein
MVPAFRIVLTSPNESLVAFVSPRAGEWLEADVLGLHAQERVEQQLDIQVLESLKPFIESVGLEEEIFQNGMMLTRAQPMNDKAVYLAALVRNFSSLQEAEDYATAHNYDQVGQYVGTLESVAEPSV